MMKQDLNLGLDFIFIDGPLLHSLVAHLINRAKYDVTGAYHRD